MPRRLNLIDHVFGRLTVRTEAPKDTRGNRKYACVCTCGNTVVVYGSNLRRGNTQSCGCLNREVVTTHGHASNGRNTPEYSSWSAMMARCYNAHNQAFASYGGRGIVVAERWHTFAHFLADMGPRPLGHTLDRYPDNNGPYAPDNCRWATMRTQSRNRRNNTLVTIGEITMPVSAWAEAHGMDRATLLYRVHTHWPLDHLFDPPLKGRQKRPH